MQICIKGVSITANPAQQAYLQSMPNGSGRTVLCSLGGGWLGSICNQTSKRHTPMTLTETEQVYLQNSRDLSSSVLLLLLRKKMHLTYERFCMLKDTQTEATCLSQLQGSISRSKLHC